jgi:hypothetical protein
MPPTSGNTPIFRPVYTVMHRPLTLCGIERRQFFIAVVIGVTTFNLFATLIGGLFVAIAYWLLIRQTMSRDPLLLRFLIAAPIRRRRYDPAKHAPFNIGVSER